MSRYRLLPTPTQEAVLRSHCAHARYIWNLAVEQHRHWRPGRKGAPGYLEQCRQLTEARAAHGWLAAGSQTVQQQALRDFSQAMAAFFDRHNPAGRPSWRKAKSYRVTMDRAGRWHVAFAAIPKPLTAPGNGQIVGVDRGVAVSAALSTGELLRVPHPGTHEHKRVLRLQRRLARAKRGSNRRRRVRLTLARLKARQADRRKDWAEKISTDLARRFDLIRVEDLDVKSMTRSARGTPQEPGRNVRQKAGLNRSIRASGWGVLVRRMYDKAPGRVEKIRPAFTSQRCSVCGHVAAESRKSQALFACVACNFTLNADVNAARNIAAGHAVTARGGDGVTRPRNREPQLLLLPV
jgi:putative transposase